MTDLETLIQRLTDHQFESHIPINFVVTENQAECNTRNLMGADPFDSMIREVEADLHRMKNGKVQQLREAESYTIKVHHVQDGMISYCKKIH